MSRYILKRILWLIPVMLIISLLSFALMYLSPGDPAMIYLSMGGDAPTEEAYLAMREKLGLDDPFWTRYANWIKGIITKGDFGTSIYTGNPVTYEIKQYFPNTLKLTLYAMLLTLVLSIPLGILSATHEGGFADVLIRGISFIASSLPGFFASLLLIYFLGVKLRWLPVISSGEKNGFVIPMLVLAITISPSYIRQIRALMIDELNSEHVRLFRSRGIKERLIVYRNALKSAVPTIFTLTGLNVGHLLGGSAIIEMVCTYHGLGRLAVNSISNRDYPLIQGFVLVMATVYVLVNLIVDIANAYADPRVRYRLLSEGGKKAEDA